MIFLKQLAYSVALAGITLSAAQAAENPIGKPHIEQGIEIAAVYLQPIKMDPPGMMRDSLKSDVHLEADIHATKDNKNGFAEGDWLPYMVISFELRKLEGGKFIKIDENGELLAENQNGKREFMPMVANDGPHYGDNVKLAGAGKYQLKFFVAPPSFNKHAHFGRHVDKETGVAEWFKPFEANYEFTYAGTGKKGGY